ncbi:MAG: hypothetical protein R6X22_02930 [Gemmatimonadota bacterium]
MSDAPVSLRDAGRGPPGEEAPDTRISHVRAPFPPPGAVAWTPRRSAGAVPAPSADGPYELVIERAVLAAMRDHVAGEPGESRFGFLLGRLFRCPTTGVHYAIADRAIPARSPFSEEAPGAILLRAWAEAQRDYRRHPGVLLGWYHRHRLLGLLLSEGDLDANRRYFGEPWQCCVLLVPDEARPLGAVFRPGLRVGDGPPGRDPTRLWELPADADDPARSRLDWTNYERGDGTSAPAAEAAGGRPARSDGRGPPPRVPRREVPPDLRSPEIGLVLADDSDERRFPRFHRDRRGLLAAAAGAALLAVFLLLRGTVGGPGGPGPVVAPRQSLTDVERSIRGLELALRGYEDRRGDFEAGRIGCDLLAGGYARVDDSFLNLAAEVARGADTAAARARFDELSTAVDDVNRHFDGSGCQRPR